MLTRGHRQEALSRAYIRAIAAQAGVLCSELPPTQPNLLLFEGPPNEDDSPTVQVPVLEQGRDYPQRVIELITDLALAEGRYDHIRQCRTMH